MKKEINLLDDELPSVENKTEKINLKINLYRERKPTLYSTDIFSGHFNLAHMISKLNVCNTSNFTKKSLITHKQTPFQKIQTSMLNYLKNVSCKIENLKKKNICLILQNELSPSCSRNKISLPKISTQNRNRAKRLINPLTYQNYLSGKSNSINTTNKSNQSFNYVLTNLSRSK